MFKCCQDEDIENFLHEKAIIFDEKNLCRVYLILDEEKFENGEIFIVAYFTLSQRSIIFSSDVSKTTIKSITKFKDRKCKNSFKLLQYDNGYYQYFKVL